MRVMALAALTMAAPAAAQQEVSIGTGAVLRGLEKVSGDATDMQLPNGGQARFGRLTITLAQCRYPVGDPAADAFAFLTIREEGRDAPVFQGWMIASSPALSALDHPRYDVWVMRCTTD
ncbi:DUF2155 domain-containing protein [Roseovarius spongiae]|uniref:DUF2155 domain-containing protein n=1 Tax=Roseovarius spongiae TaxID=2320272 RepID=A0A3A8AYX4_9RHOB|nr:DUF2155 domain-containing protein [Roseovarius spongiae]RKF17257.1 DUF2155 domain-containing protein [Roseovarius spongiae]